VKGEMAVRGAALEETEGLEGWAHRVRETMVEAVKIQQEHFLVVAVAVVLVKLDRHP
jgi:hypothetical protein